MATTNEIKPAAAARKLPHARSSEGKLNRLANMGTRQELRFYSPDGTPTRICLPDGRTCIVGEQPRKVHPAFNQAATRAGLLVHGGPTAEQLRGPVTPEEFQPDVRTQRIHDAIEDALNGDDGDPAYVGAFTNAGIPDVKWLSSKVGFSVTRDERDQAWTKIQDDLEEEEGNAAGTGNDGSGAQGDAGAGTPGSGIKTVVVE